jgi:hypothetical protein
MIHKKQVSTQFPVSYRSHTAATAVHEMCKYCGRDFGCDWNPYYASPARLHE